MPIRVLIVEDEPMIAFDLKAMVETRAGFTVGAIAGTVAEARARILSGEFDAVLLDVNLGGETSETLTPFLKEQRVPYIVLTGYAPAQLPPAFAERASISKPVNEVKLQAALDDLRLSGR